jgi:hypothetical protein
LQFDDEQLLVPVPATSSDRNDIGTSTAVDGQRVTPQQQLSVTVTALDSNSDIINKQQADVAADVTASPAAVERLWMLILARDILVGPFQEYIAEQQQHAKPLSVAHTLQLLQQCIDETLNSGVAEDTAAVEHLMKELAVACQCNTELGQSETEVLQHWCHVVQLGAELAEEDLIQVYTYAFDISTTAMSDSHSTNLIIV